MCEAWDAAAALSDEKKSLTLAIVNPTESQHLMEGAVQGVAPRNQGQMWRVAGSSVDAHNEPYKLPVLEIVESAIE